jgi:hypothetical protein
MAINYSPKIITDGLVLYLDAANTKSYVSGSTTWNDISRGGNNGILVNNPTFNPNFGGSLSTNSSAYIDFNTPTQNNPLELTIEMVCIFNSTPFIRWITYGQSDTSPLQNRITLRSSNAPPSFNLSITVYANQTTGELLHSTNFLKTSPNPTYITLTLSNTGVFTIYVNGTPSITSVTPNFVNWSIGNNPSRIQNVDTNNLYLFKVYNRALTQQEITQNYNATKGRFQL